MMRRLVGLLLLLSGVLMLLADAHVAYLAQSAAHGVNVGASLLLVFAGLWVLMPAVAQAFAKELLEAIPALGTLWPGGSRRYDPPPQPGVPPPPSVTSVPRDDLTKPPSVP
jgi:hypothetical protein